MGRGDRHRDRGRPSRPALDGPLPPSLDL